MTIAIIVSLVVLALTAYAIHANTHAKNLMHIGLAASQGYLYHGGAECRLAALTAKSVLAQPLGQKMLYYVESIVCPQEGIGREDFESRKTELLHSLAQQESGVTASVKRKGELNMVSPDWHRAISRADRPLAERLFAIGVACNEGKGAVR